MTVLRSRKYDMGKMAPPKEHVPIPRAYFVRLFIGQLNSALKRNARVLTKLYARKVLDIKLQEQIEIFSSEVILVIDSFPKNGQRIPAAFFKKIQHLKTTQKEFVIDYQQFITSSCVNSRRVAFVTKWLAEDVQHLIINIEKTYSSIPAVFEIETGELLPPNVKNIPNRQRNPKMERIFLEAIKKYQDGDGNKKFMTYKFVQSLMEQAELSFSERSYGIFKTDYLAGRFGKLVR